VVRDCDEGFIGKIYETGFAIGVCGVCKVITAVELGGIILTVIRGNREYKFSHTQCGTIVVDLWHFTG
jgi:hypothetical protein